MAVRKKKVNTAPAAEPVSSVKKEAWPRVYVGPTVRGGFLTPNRVFANGYPQPVLDLLEAHPEMKVLFVPVSGLRAALGDIANKGTLLNAIYSQTQKIIGGLNV